MGESLIRRRHSAPASEARGAQRSPTNPIFTRTDILDIPPHVVDVSPVFNPGVIRVGERYLLLRWQIRGRETVLMAAKSTDGGRFSVRPRIVEIEGIETADQPLYHVCDPRLTWIDDTISVVFAADTNKGCRPGAGPATTTVGPLLQACHRRVLSSNGAAASPVANAGRTPAQACPPTPARPSGPGR